MGEFDQIRSAPVATPQKPGEPKKAKTPKAGGVGYFAISG
jgi:hypothetical protein